MLQLQLQLQLHLPHLSTSLSSITYPRFNHHDSNFHHHRLRLSTQLLHTPPSYRSTLTPRTHNLILSHIASCTTHNDNTVAEDFDVNFQHQKSRQVEQQQEGTHEKNFWGAVSLIIGTAVGPGMLGLPAVINNKIRSTSINHCHSSFVGLCYFLHHSCCRVLMLIFVKGMRRAGG